MVTTEGGNSSLVTGLTSATATGDNRTAILGFGVDLDSSPFIKAGSTVKGLGLRLPVDQPSFLVGRIERLPNGKLQIRLRIYSHGEKIDQSAPKNWAIISEPQPVGSELSSFVLQTGETAHWLIDHLRIGTSWQSVTQNN